MYEAYQVGIFKLVDVLVYAVNRSHFVVYVIFVGDVVASVVTQKTWRKLVFFRTYANRNVRILKNPFVDLLGVVTYDKNFGVHFSFTSV